MFNPSGFCMGVVWVYMLIDVALYTDVANTRIPRLFRLLDESPLASVNSGHTLIAPVPYAIPIPILPPPFIRHLYNLVTAVLGDSVSSIIYECHCHDCFQHNQSAMRGVYSHI